MFNTRRFFSNAVVSVAQTIISGLVLFVLYRYLIDHMGAEQLGLWSVILASTSVARLSDMGLTGSVVKFVARYRALKDDSQAAEVVQTAALSIAGVMSVLCLAGYPLLENVLILAIPPASMHEAMNILPWAVFSLWLGSVGGVFQSSLDGCQRMDIRNIIMIVGNVFFLAASFWLVPNFGLIGLAVGQAAQGLMLMLVSWFVLRRQLTTLPLVPLHWSKTKFKEMFGYSVNFQINTLAIIFFEPVTKLLMSRYGGLSSAAYFEMANQLVVKLRALLVAASQALVPAVAELHEKAPEKIRELYLKSYRMLFFVSIPFFAAILISLPLISELWIGHIEAQFLIFGALLTLGWGLNCLTGPAYFINLGTGDIKWNSMAHVMMAILNVLLGLTLGSILGGLGVAISAVFSLIVASGFILYKLHNQLKISVQATLPSEHHLLFLATLLCIVLMLWINTSHWLAFGVIEAGLASLGSYLMVVGVAIWFHPYRPILIGMLRGLEVEK